MQKARLPQPETTIEDIIAGKNSEVAAALKGVAAAKAKPSVKVPLPVRPRSGRSHFHRFGETLMSFLSRIMVLKSRAHFSSGNRGRGNEKASFEGTRKRKSAQAKNRVGLLIAGFAVFYCVIGGRLVQYGVAQPLTTSSILPADRAACLASRYRRPQRRGSRDRYSHRFAVCRAAQDRRRR